MTRIASLAFASAFVLAACGGATESDLFGNPPTGDGGTTDGGGTDTGPLPDGSNCGACGTPAPAGFRYVRYQNDRNGACPGGTTQTDVISGVADVVPCACSCKVNPPDCGIGNLTRSSDNDPNASCNQQGTTLSASAPNCTPFQNFTIFLQQHIKVAPPQIQGTCTTEAKADLTAAGGTLGRLCDAPAECTGVVCGGPNKCVAQAGDVECPKGFGKKTLVGTGVNAKCNDCPACKADVQCGGTLSFFTNQQCTTGQLDMPADGVCGNRPPQANGIGYQAYTYKPTVKSATCTPGGDTKGPTSLEAVTTVCCAN
jgi:hypothetical protein